MEWNMLNESKKLFPHWLDKSENSNFSKHLKILNHQQTDMRHKLKTIEWSKLLNKPLQIHKVQVEPYKWKIEFEVDVERLREVNIYKNPTIVNNEVVNSVDVVNGYFHNGSFYENHSKVITNLDSSVDDESMTYYESDISKFDEYVNLIHPNDDSFYFDLDSKVYYRYSDGDYSVVDEDDLKHPSLIHSESFIDNYSHFYRYIYYDSNDNDVIVAKSVVDDDGEQLYKTVLDYPVSVDNGKFELYVVPSNDFKLYYNVKTGKYCVLKNGEYVELSDNKVVKISGSSINNVNVDNSEGVYYVFTDADEDVMASKIPLIELNDISPVISNDKYVLEVITWDDYHFLKGFPEIDFIDYNNNNIIDDNEKTYDNLSITVEKINENDYLTFRVHQYGIKLVEVFKDDKPIHIADFVVEKLGFSDKYLNTNFAHIYDYINNEVYYPNKDTDSLEEVVLDNDEYVWRLKLTDDDKILDSKGNWNYELKSNYDLKVTYYDSLHYDDSEYDKILTKRYVYEDSIFYHDVSLDMMGKLISVPRYVYRQPIDSLISFNEQADYYARTYPKYCNTFSEDDYHYQKRLMYYINNYNKVYFPVLELWKYFHIDSRLVNRKEIIAEQNYSYLRTLREDENKYINELGRNKLESFFLNDEYVTEEEEKNLQKPITKSIISPDDYLNSRDCILVDDNNNYIKDVDGNYVKTNYEYDITVNEETGEKEYRVKKEYASRVFNWYNAVLNGSSYEIKLTKKLDIVPSTAYQLRFCVKEYPLNDLKLRVIYKNNDDNVIDIYETVPERKDYDDNGEYNELIYSDYKKEWNLSCEYICTDFVTLDNARTVEIILESESGFKISDVTLQRITLNHYDTEYMRTSTDYNSCVYDLYADYTQIPSNIRYENLNIFNEILNRSLPITKTGYFNFIFENNNLNNDMILDTETNIYIEDLISVVTQQDNYANVLTPTDDYYQYSYYFNRYVRTGEYEIVIKPYYPNENDIIDDFKIEISMVEFYGNNTSKERKVTIDNFEEYLVTDDTGRYYKIPFMNISNHSIRIKIYRESKFKFKDFKLIKKSPLTMEELVL